MSSYLYHLRCSEPWCINHDLSLVEPILFPRVPYSQQQFYEPWKRHYLISLEGRSYQDNLRALATSAGLLFELNHYAGWTIDSMLQWHYDQPSVLEVHFERLYRGIR